MSDTLEQTIADAREEAAVLERNGASFSVQRVREIMDAVQAGAEGWLTWLSEKDASIRCGKAEAWLRARFEEMRREENARLVGRNRQYRQCAVPRHANILTAAARGREAAQAARKSA